MAKKTSLHHPSPSLEVLHLNTTWYKNILVSPNPESTKTNKQAKDYDLIWWLVVAIAILAASGALLFFIKLLGTSKKFIPSKSDTLSLEGSRNIDSQQQTQPPQELDTTLQVSTTSQTVKLLPPSPTESTSRLAKVNIVEELIQDLNSPDPIKRRKAIWSLGQQGDSRAIQPLVDLMIDADSQQRSLILAALAEIGISTLKPMNNALAISLRDQSPQVRQNAIRDLTRVYDMMAQISQILCHAVQDSDPDVQATARYALAQMNRIRSLPSGDSLSDNSPRIP
ncbi:PBS lyase [Fischerella thermalis CCMEE 5268]|uniref:PBS lyase n=2 Tax=Fischerella TaxID=1190 RepID=A0A2N6KH26_9CYAN|nr:HEAT repeat domain-containing protein [Fischerella thermalis]PLZ98621.1 PBS lyase [Fischerella thermalis CCMEE 5268]